MSQVFADAENQLFNVVVVSEYPCHGGVSRHSEIVSHQPVDFARGSKWVHGIMTGIGRDWATSRFVDIYIEPADCRRPMTQDIQSMLSREELRRNSEDSVQRSGREEREHLTAQLHGSAGITHTGASA